MTYKELYEKTNTKDRDPGKVLFIVLDHKHDNGFTYDDFYIGQSRIVDNRINN